MVEVGFRFLEHTADIYVEAWGSTIDKSFEDAALALFEVMIDTSSVKPIREDTIAVVAKDKYELLYKWLEKLIQRFEIDNIVYSKFQVEITKTPSNALCLKATILGEVYDKERHPSKVGVKAVTYHRMQVTERKGKTTLRFILDI